MANKLNSTINKFSNKNFYINKNELKNRILFLIISVIIFRIGSLIPIPGINITVLSKILYQNSGNLLDMLNVFSGGSISKASIFSLGIMPYISSSIIIQLLTLINSKFKNMKKNGEIGKIQINRYTKYLSFILAIVQSICISISLSNIYIFKDLVINSGICFYILCSFSLVTGTMFLIWIGELITKYGIGNGMSIIIFLGIISGIPHSIINVIEKFRLENINYFLFLFLIIFIFSVIFFITFIERSYYKINVQYANINQRKMSYITNNSHLPLKVNIVGVIPAIFASSIVLLPYTIFSWIISFYKNNLLINFLKFLQPNSFFYTFSYIVLIIFFCFFYTNLTFNSKDTSENLKKSGAFIRGIRPGNKTSEYIKKIVTKLTFIGSLYISFVCMVPEFVKYFLNSNLYFGGTSLLIVIVVIIDCISQIQNIIVSNMYYKNFKNSNNKIENNFF
ncbi:preprotein translocase subunit SecY [Buchnera aphidicola (Ceratovacuna keduensis)]|uniref:preprotein translocase subunit SecY n=1 Tax=Buchnera aphidicola TaxID=9 RepID=UPI0031B850B1